MTKEELKVALVDSLTTQGFNVNGHVAPSSLTKTHFKKIQAFSKKEQLIIQKDFLAGSYDTIKDYLIDGQDINPAKIELELRMVEEGSLEHTLFRWCSLSKSLRKTNALFIMGQNPQCSLWSYWFTKPDIKDVSS